MRIASHTLAYNVSRFLPDVIDNVGPHVDRIFVAYSRRPWGYNPAQRETAQNQTSMAEFRGSRWFDKIEFVEGDWETEEAMRNACLDRAKAQGFDWLITHDADEFYTEQSWRQARRFLEEAGEDIVYVKTTWYNYWKSAQYLLVYDHGGIKDTNVNFAVRCRDDIHFASARVPNVPKAVILDAPCHHFGWAISDEEMWLKVQTWKHTREFDPKRWYALKWAGWTERTHLLHPVKPWFWARAVRTPFELPDFAQKYANSIEGQAVPSFRQYVANSRYDASWLLYSRLRYMRRTLRGGGESSR